MAETFLVRLSGGGPHDGNRTTVPGTPQGTWPLPAVLGAPGGLYVKESESQLPPQEEDSHVMRGAQYKWVPDETEEADDGRQREN